MIEISVLYTRYGDTPHWSLKMDNQGTLDISQERMGSGIGVQTRRKTWILRLRHQNYYRDTCCCGEHELQDRTI